MLPILLQTTPLRMEQNPHYYCSVPEDDGHGGPAFSHYVVMDLPNLMIRHQRRESPRISENHRESPRIRMLGTVDGVPRISENLRESPRIRFFSTMVI